MAGEETKAKFQKLISMLDKDKTSKVDSGELKQISLV